MMRSSHWVGLMVLASAVLMTPPAAASVTLWDTGAPHIVNYNGTDAYLGFISGNAGVGSEQRWSAVPFRLTSDAVIEQLAIDWFDAGTPADNVNYIIWNRTTLDAPVDGDQFAAGVLGAFSAGADDPRIPGLDDWYHLYDTNIPIAAGDYYLTVYGDGGPDVNTIAWLTGGDLQAEDLEQDFMWRSAQFPAPGFLAYAPGNVQPLPGMDPQDLWNPSFTLFGTPVPEPASAGLLAMGLAAAMLLLRRRKAD